MVWARMLAYITGTVDQELLSNSEEGISGKVTRLKVTNSVMCNV